MSGWRSYWWGIWIVLSLLLAACGPGGGSSSTSGSGGTDTQNEGVDVPDLKTVEEVLAHIEGLDPAQRKAVLEAGAKKENAAVNYYSTMNEDDLQSLQEALAKSYPWLKVQAWRGDESDLITRLTNEFRAGANKVDVFTIETQYSYDLGQEGIIASYTPPNIDEFPEGLYDPDGMWVAQQAQPVSLTWNTSKIDAADLPNTWEDLTDPKYSGRFSLGTDDNELLFYWQGVFGKEKGTELAEGIAANKPNLVRGTSNQVQLLSAGEFDFSAAITEHSTLRFVKQGAPLDFKYLEGAPVFVKTEGIFLAKNAPSPYSAVLMMDWLTSVDGQQAVADMGRPAALPTVKFPMERQGEVLQTHELWSANPNEFGPVVEEISAEYNRIFGLTQ